MFKKIILLILLVSSCWLVYSRTNQRNSAQENFAINSKEYWDFRFKSLDWQNNNGNEQNLHFYTLMLNALPKILQEEINNNNYNILDFGCAQGAGTAYFAHMLPNALVSGIDLSEEAIKIAKKKHPEKVQFISEDITKKSLNGTKFDIIISSNTLEHFVNP
jgi:2-polyprenyl-3-methyl-5-hydroxy-6-metoxy-1,4-benzoquinol methylase